jgi:hypothetical protein
MQSINRPTTQSSKAEADKSTGFDCSDCLSISKYSQASRQRRHPFSFMIRADDGADLHHVAGSHPPLAISQIAASDNTAEPRTATGPTGRLPTDQAPGKRGRWTANHRATAPSDGGQARSNQSPIACVPTEARSRVEPLNISRLSNVAVEKSQRPAGNSRR